MSTRLDNVLDAIDAANAADPNITSDNGTPVAAELLYGRRMSAELARICPDASEHLRIAARGQHIERWKTPRATFPDGREGYLAWRRSQAAYHAERVGAIMTGLGYDAADSARVGAMLRKTGIKRDPEVQMLEDVICLVFMRWYFADFAARHDADRVFNIVAKTARKMSARGRDRIAAEFDLPAHLAPALVV